MEINAYPYSKEILKSMEQKNKMRLISFLPHMVPSSKETILDTEKIDEFANGLLILVNGVVFNSDFCTYTHFKDVEEILFSLHFISSEILTASKKSMHSLFMYMCVNQHIAFIYLYVCMPI